MAATAGDDSLPGTDGADTIDGLAGADSVFGFNGDDRLVGGLGDDSLDGGLDNDSLEGGDGSDWLAGGQGADTLSDSGLDGADNGLDGGDGDDVLSAAGGFALLMGGGGNDRLMLDGGSGQLEGGGGDDRLVATAAAHATLFGEDGADTLLGGTGVDGLAGGAGDDSLSGGGGNDLLFGGDDADRLDGGDGADQLSGGSGADTLAGGAGDDRYIGFAAELNGDRIDGYQSGEAIALFQSLAGAAAVQLLPSGGDTLLRIDADGTPGFESAITLTGPVSGSVQLSSEDGLTNNVIRIVGPPVLSISPDAVAHPEGQAGQTAFTFTVTRTGDLSGAVAADWAVTATGANRANSGDFVGAMPAGQVSFAPGQSTASIVVEVRGDTVFERDEVFTVTLSNPTGGASLGPAVAQGQILDDDAKSWVAISPSAAQNEGSAGSKPYVFEVVRTGDLSEQVAIDWAVAGSGPSPVDKDDFGGAGLPSGKVRFEPGQSHAVITLQVSGDLRTEADEGFTVTLSFGGKTPVAITAPSAAGLILNDDPAGLPAIAAVFDNENPRQGLVDDGGSTNDRTPTVRVSLLGAGVGDGDAVQLMDNGVALATGRNLPTIGRADLRNGYIDIDVRPLADGTVHAFTAMIVRTGATTPDPYTITIDQTPPSPVIDDVQLGPAAWTVLGRSDPGSAVQVRTGGQVLGSAVADASGDWTMSIAPQTRAVRLDALATDAAGNVGPSDGVAWVGTAVNQKLDGTGGGDLLLGLAGDDILNAHGGDDRLVGGLGADTATGGAGDDLFVYDGGRDRIVDLRAGAGSDDVLQIEKAMLGLPANASDADAFAAIMSRAAASAGGTLITFSASDAVQLSGVAPASLHPDDFLFV